MSCHLLQKKKFQPIALKSLCTVELTWITQASLKRSKKPVISARDAPPALAPPHHHRLSHLTSHISPCLLSQVKSSLQSISHFKSYYSQVGKQGNGWKDVDELLEEKSTSTSMTKTVGMKITEFLSKIDGKKTVDSPKFKPWAFFLWLPTFGAWGHPSIFFSGLSSTVLCRS